MPIPIASLNTPKISSEEIRNEFILYESSSSTYRFQMAEDEEFYLGNQLTQAQKEYLISVGQPPEANNKIRPAVETVLAHIASSSPEWDVLPFGKGDEDFAYVLNQILDKIWLDSHGDVQFRKACKDYLVKGIGYCFVYPDWNADKGLGAIRVRRIPPEAVFVDPNSSMADLSDASSIIYSDVHTRASLLTLFPRYRKHINDAEQDNTINETSSGKYSRDDMMTPADMPDDHQEKVRKFLHWSKVNIPMARITDMTTGFTQVYTKDEYKEFISDEKYNIMIGDGIIEEEVIYDTKIREVCAFGDVICYDKVLPISTYPVQCAMNEHTGTPFPAGDVRHAKAPQRMLNRTEALLISHINATTNFKLVYEDGAIDPEEIVKWSIPNAVVRANPGALREGKIKEFSPSAVSAQLYTEKQRYELDIEQVFGAYKYMQGSTQDAPGTVGEAQIVDEAVARKQNWKVLPIYDMLNSLAMVALEWFPVVYDQQRAVRVLAPDGRAQEITLNQPVWDDRSASIKKAFDMGSINVDIKIVIGSTRAKSPSAILSRDLQLLEVGIYDRTQVIMNLPGDVDKASLMERHGQIEGLMSENKGLMSEVEKLKGDLQTREREIFHANMRAEISEATKPVAQAVSNVKANARLQEQRQRDKTAEVGRDLDVALDAVNSDEEKPQAPEKAKKAKTG